MSLDASLHVAGLSISVYRSSLDGRLVVYIDTSDLDYADTYPGSCEIPRIRVSVNEDDQNIAADGSFEPMDYAAVAPHDRQRLEHEESDASTTRQEPATGTREERKES